MITECYIKGRYDFGIGKCAVVVAEKGVLLHKVAWKVPPSWDYDGETILADQYNCEILAACYALDWCRKNEKELVNIYANTTTAKKWYYNQEFPQSRMPMGKAYYKAYDDFCNERDKKEVVNGRICAEYIPKDETNKWDILVNDLAVNVR